MDESNKDWTNQQSLSQPSSQSSQSQPPAFSVPSGIAQSTPITATSTGGGFNGYWPQQFYTHYSQWLNQQQMMNQNGMFFLVGLSVWTFNVAKEIIFEITLKRSKI
jgi:hypothetical protein